MPKPMTVMNFDKISYKVRDVTKDTSEASINPSADVSGWDVAA